jgi:hypothetical protein
MPTATEARPAVGVLGQVAISQGRRMAHMFMRTPGPQLAPPAPAREAVSMHDMNRIANCCGVVISRTAQGLVHQSTAWSVAPGEWITAWPGDEPEEPIGGLSLILARDGSVHPLSGWEYDGGVVGLKGPDIGNALEVHDEGVQLHKRDRIFAMAYPDMIDHPTVRLARGPLTLQLYFPYFCPWTMQGHLSLFTSSQGFLTGRFYAGMAGGPVLGSDGKVVGVLLGGDASPDHPPLTRFARLA